MGRILCFILFLTLSLAIFSKNDSGNYYKRQRALSDMFLYDAMQSMNSGDPAQAYDLLSHSLELCQGNAAAHYEMCHLLSDFEDYDGALEHALQAATLDTTNSWYWHTLALAFSAKGNLAAETNVLIYMTEHFPKRTDILFTLAQNYFVLHEPELAVETMKRYAAIEGDDPAVKFQLFCYYMELRQMDSAYSQTMQQPTAFVETILENATAQEFLQVRDDLAEYLQYVKTVRKELPRTYTLLATIYFTLDSQRAVEVLREGIGQISDSVELSNCYQMLSDYYSAVDSLEQTYDCYDHLLRLAPRESPMASMICNNYAYLLATHDGDLELALELSRRSLVNGDIKNGIYLDTFAWVLFKLGRYEEALEIILLSIENMVEPEQQAVAWEHSGDILWHCDRREDALSNWKKAYELYGIKRPELLWKKISGNTYLE